MEENKNYTEPEKIEQTEPEQSQEPKNVKSKKEKKPLGKKQWIIIGAAILLAVAVVVVVVIWLTTGDKDETPATGKWYPAESVEDSPLDVDPKQEDVFYD